MMSDLTPDLSPWLLAFFLFAVLALLAIAGRR
jgi:hypothetical protein